MALYRTARFDEAVSVLERALVVRNDHLAAFDLNFLEMAHARMGHREQALDRFNQAIRWLEARENPAPDTLRERSAFRAEAEAILNATSRTLSERIFAQ